eukprot:scaffold1781_cov416-Prasinococcus_capsulatus_cf.AAC.1
MRLPETGSVHAPAPAPAPSPRRRGRPPQLLPGAGAHVLPAARSVKRAREWRGRARRARPAPAGPHSEIRCPPIDDRQWRFWKAEVASPVGAAGTGSPAPAHVFRLQAEAGGAAG